MSLLISWRTRYPHLNIYHPIHFLSLGFGLGLIKKAPGTFGTLAAFPFYYLLQSVSIITYVMTVITFFICGVVFCQKTSDVLKEHDASVIVWDEIVGMLITMIALPKGVIWIVSAFVLFRFFDIVKPFPISYFDKHMTGGLGIMFDDVIAGIFALALIQFSAYFFLL